MMNALLVVILLEGAIAASNVASELPTRKVIVHQFMLPEKNTWSISQGEKKICEGGPYTNWYAEVQTDCKLPTGSYSITCCDTRSKEGWTGGYVRIEKQKQKLCQKFKWNSGKECYTQKFRVVVPTPKPTPVPCPKPTEPEFGMYDFSESPGKCWVRVGSLSELNKVKDEFIKFYNKNKGIPTIKPWISSNCNFASSSGEYLDIGNSKAFMVPWQGKKYWCNYKAYSGVFQFAIGEFGAQKPQKTLPSNTQFTENTRNGYKAEKESKNPGFYRYMR